MDKVISDVVKESEANFEKAYGRVIDRNGYLILEEELEANMKKFILNDADIIGKLYFSKLLAQFALKRTMAKE